MTQIRGNMGRWATASTTRIPPPLCRWKKAASCLEDAGVAYKAEFTGGKYNATELSRKAAERGYRKFIAVGGDGTIHDVLNGIAEYAQNSTEVTLSDFTLAVLPVGSGNDWVKSVGVSRDIQQAVSCIAAGITAVFFLPKIRNEGEAK